MTPRPLTIAAAAERWGLSTRTLHRCVAAGSLRVVKITAKKWIVPWDEIERVDREGGLFYPSRSSTGDDQMPTMSSGAKTALLAASVRGRVTGG